MNKLLIIITYILFSAASMQAQPLSLSLDADAEELVEAIQGEGVTILNAEVDCHWTSRGTYEDPEDLLGIGDGIVLSTANLLGLYSSNTEFPAHPLSATPPIFSTNIDSTYHYWLLNSWDFPTNNLEITFFASLGGCALLLDIVPEYTTLSFDYVLGDGLLDSIIPIWPGDTWGQPINWLSHAHGSIYICTCNCYPQVDFISALIMGGSLADTLNLAVFPEGQYGSSNVPVNRYTLRMDEEMFDYMCMAEGGAEGLYWDGGPYLDYCRFNQAGGSIEDPSLRLRGMTIPMTASIELEANDTYKLVLSTGKMALKHPIGTGYNVSHGRAAYFISNLHSSSADTSTGVQDVATLPGMSIAPNPFSEELRISYTTASEAESFHILMSDITGRTWLQAEGNIQSINQQLEKIAPTLSRGTYLIQMIDMNTARSKVFKVVKN